MDVPARAEPPVTCIGVIVYKLQDLSFAEHIGSCYLVFDSLPVR